MKPLCLCLALILCGCAQTQTKSLKALPRALPPMPTTRLPNQAPLSAQRARSAEVAARQIDVTFPAPALPPGYETNYLTIEYSTNAVTWIPVATNLYGPSSGTMIFTNTGETIGLFRYIRQSGWE